MFPNEGAMIAVAVKMTPSMRDKLYRLGGGTWVRDMLMRADEPDAWPDQPQRAGEPMGVERRGSRGAPDETQEK